MEMATRSFRFVFQKRIKTLIFGALVLGIKPTLSPPIPRTWCHKGKLQLRSDGHGALVLWCFVSFRSFRY